MINLDSDVKNISRVGEVTAKKLKNIGIETVHDLLFYFPFRYEDFRQVTPIDKLQAGQVANIVGQIELIQNKRSPRKRMSITEALISDHTETIKAVWFNQPFISKNLKIGDKISLAGKVEDDYGGLIIKSPVYEKINYAGPVHTQGLVPDYHLTANVTQKQIRFLIKQIINQSEPIPDWLPIEVRQRQKLLNLDEAVKKIHFPKDYIEIEKARKRLAFNELLLLQIQSRIIKNDLESIKASPIKFNERKTREFVKSLPYKLTNAQKKAAWEILGDLSKDRPMMRLLEGDVGSGKTIVAVIAMLNSALNKKKSVLMAPTEILAKQHFNTISKLLNNFNLRIGLVTSNDKTISNFKTNPKTKNPKTTSQDVISKSQIIIGTHALIQENIKFENLGLAIIDEQHRFGVEQRAVLLGRESALNLRESAQSPHLLSMTATPIPRSLALALYGELELSVINEMPKGRKRILTKIVPEDKRQKAYEFIRQQIKNGRQVFVICPLIDISDKLGSKSVKEEFIKLDKFIFPEVKIGLMHGKLKNKEKEAVMQKFLENEIKILVSTSVVEVGVDIPNATVMMIEGADRFGLAQLHQFRGRVGRSEYQSYCFLFTDSDSDNTSQRLNALENCYDGFSLAKTDLKFRGPGEVFGTAQKGFPELRIASLFDYELMKMAKDEAEIIVKENPELNKYPLLKQKFALSLASQHLE